jgi:D-alanyl-lipoteichoic acid acyltransferase DltB (MBOAT superfamily)
MVNFRRPFASKSLGELWGRWHISLNNWFKDYLYVPLGGNRHGKFKLYRNVFIVFLISGLWHGASYNFIIWGMLHGIFVLILSKSGISNLFHLQGFPLLKTTAQKVFTFLLFSVLFIFFYPKNIQQSIQLMSNLFSDWLPWFEAVRISFFQGEFG